MGVSDQKCASLDAALDGFHWTDSVPRRTLQCGRRSVEPGLSTGRRHPRPDPGSGASSFYSSWPNICIYVPSSEFGSFWRGQEPCLELRPCYRGHWQFSVFIVLCMLELQSLQFEDEYNQFWSTARRSSPMPIMFTMPRLPCLTHYNAHLLRARLSYCPPSVKVGPHVIDGQ